MTPVVRLAVEKAQAATQAIAMSIAEYAHILHPDLTLADDFSLHCSQKSRGM